MTCFISELLT